ncbi:MAG: DNA polymerase III subunit beta [Clostridia bacterium]|nr:DNA polymerase III subunit beta [Clostridia bacterium]
MKIIFDRLQLNERITPLLNTISNKNINPALEGVLIEAKENQECILTTFDNERGTRTTIQAKVEQPGSCVIPAIKLAQTLRLMDEDDLVIDVDEKMKTVISSGISRYNLISIDSGKFAGLPRLSGEKGFTIAQNVLKKMIGKTMFAMASNDARPALNGTYVIINAQQITMVACDSFRLAKSTKNVEINSIGEDEEINLKFIVPERAINDLYKLLEDDEKKKADIYISKKNMVVNVGNYIFFTKLIEGDYIPYENIINMKHKLHLKVNKDEFLAALERASLITDEKSSNRKKEYIKLEISSDRMILKAESSAGATYDEIDVEYKGDPIIIGFSNRFMIENTRAIDCDEICIDMSSAFTATNMYAADPEEDSDQYMILPVKVN